MSYILVLVVILVAGVLIAAAMRPDTFRITREATIVAPPEKIFPLIGDFRNWSLWSPWERKDPAMTRTFSDATAGVGASYAWSGNRNVGQGSMTITESAPPSRLVLNLDFIKPFEAHNIVEFTLTPLGTSTQVTWTMHGPQPFLSKVFGLLLNMDRMVGKDFEAGLANLKAAAEPQSLTIEAPSTEA